MLFRSGWVAQALGLPEGTTTAAYSNQLSNRSSGGSGGSSSGTNSPPEDIFPEITVPQKLNIWQQATELAKSGRPPTTDTYGNIIEYQPNYDDIYNIYIQLATQLGYSPYDLQQDNSLLQELEKEMTNRTMQNDPLLNPTGGSLLWDLARLWKNTNK